MTSIYNHRNASREQSFVKAQTQDFVQATREIYPKANTIYKNDIQFYDSHVKNSHLYPNMYHIRPINLDNKPSDIGAYIDKSIQANKQYAFGPYVLPVKELKWWA